jgi:hypothetical protein
LRKADREALGKFHREVLPCEGSRKFSLKAMGRTPMRAAAGEFHQFGYLKGTAHVESMSQLATEERIQIMVEEAKKILKKFGLSGETYLANKEAVAALCGTPIEQRRISVAKQIETIATATGRYPYVVLAFRGPSRTLCVPDANYYVADGLYDVHVVECAGKEAL